MTGGRRAVLGGLAIAAVMAAALLAMGRPPICACGEIDAWGAVGPTQSQMLADWYSPSHFIHGLLFYALMWLVARQWSVQRRFLVAAAIEAAWEVIENTPMVIDRYREATAALGYVGDSVLNSLTDFGFMAIGFLAARKLPIWVSAVLIVILELIPLLAVRDNLTLNILMLIAPSDAILEWQSRA